ncbi:MAG: hypothetical protein K8T89_10680 [Planctomycetes bacterium]|nr:hypothetical protein [Planctomycetota bacterium]
MRRIVFGTILFVSACLIAGSGMSSWAADPTPDSVAAKLTRDKKMKAKIDLDCDNMMLRELIEELKGGLKDAKVGTVRISIDPKSKGSITLTTRMSIKCKKMTFEDALDKMLTDSGRPWGYYINVSAKKDDQDDGAIFIVADATCRGYPPGDARNPKPKEEVKKPK